MLAKHNYVPSFHTDSNQVLSQLPAAAYSCLYIDRQALVNNFRFLEDKIGDARCAAVVKADSYGLGAIPLSQTLAAQGCSVFFVSYLDEGISLRQALADHKATIYVLNGFFPGCEAEFLEHDLTPVLTDIEQVERWRTLAVACAQELPTALHVDTGMHRTGIPDAQVQILRDQPQRLTGLSLKLVMSHLASSSSQDDDFNRVQRQRFLNARQCLPLAPASLVSSSGIFLGSSYHFNITRPGMALYGLNPTPNQPNPMQPLVSLWAKIYQVQDVSPGETVGYFQTYTAQKPQRVATIACGYADGVPWLMGNQGAISIGSYVAPLVGRISMDLITVDVTDIPESLVVPGLWVELLGKTNELGSWVNFAQTSSHDVLMNLRNRPLRVYSEIT
ncbi:MAG: alanine racemase [Alphaproteobacteria bacterium]